MKRNRQRRAAFDNKTAQAVADLRRGELGEDLMQSIEHCCADGVKKP